MIKLFTTLLFISMMTIVHAADWVDSDESCFKQGDMNASAGLSLFHFGVYGTFDYAFHGAFSAGAGFGYNGHEHDASWRYNYFPIVARVLFHPLNLSVLAERYDDRDKLDVYDGVSMGWRVGWVKFQGAESPFELDDPKIGGFTIRENFGARYYLTPNWYIY